MSLEATDTEDNASSLSEASSLDDDFDRMNLEFDSSDEDSTDDDVNSHVWNEIEYQIRMKNSWRESWVRRRINFCLKR